MAKGIGLQSMSKTVKQYWVVGRQLPSEETPNPKCFRIRVFAKNTVLAKTRFWYEMKRQNKVRKCQGEIVQVSEIFERKTTSVKNYGIVLKYLTRTGVVNMYKEYRSNSLNDAVSQMYSEMAGRHSARSENIHIIKTTRLENSAVKRPQTLQFMKTSLRFPKFTQNKRAPTAAHKSTFTASRPILV
uniref:60S ribosomal protein L18a n=1 Tax=Strombidium inclinatum TaxID=197538 RepID=A0A7S3IDS8_9SPIT|mmetsp:Transcript_13073/g.20304  ORF Transcript_13073/g.20304 Transcript_13073/m.20304 type:complete len:186 (+) Transcript_13073:70-627(+)